LKGEPEGRKEGRVLGNLGLFGRIILKYLSKK
jgi:hypothetical protein